MDPEFYGPMEPVHPCRVMPTRHCPVIYDDVCGDRPCARHESDDEAPWEPEVGRVTELLRSAGLSPQEGA